MQERPHQVLPEAAGPAGLNQPVPFAASDLQWVELLPSDDVDRGVDSFQLALFAADRVRLDLPRGVNQEFALVVSGAS